MNGDLFFKDDIGIFACLVIDVKIVKDDGDGLVLVDFLVVVLCIGYVHESENSPKEQCEDFEHNQIFVEDRLARTLMVLHDLEKFDQYLFHQVAIQPSWRQRSDTIELDIWGVECAFQFL